MQWSSAGRSVHHPASLEVGGPRTQWSSAGLSVHHPASLASSFSLWVQHDCLSFSRPLCVPCTLAHRKQRAKAWAMDLERKSSRKSFLVGDGRLRQAAAEQKPLQAALTVAWNTGAAGRGGTGVWAAGTGSECLKEFR